MKFTINETTWENGWPFEFAYKLAMECQLAAQILYFYINSSVTY